MRSRDSVVGIAIGYGLDDRGVGVRIPVGSRSSSSPSHPDRLYGQPNLLSNGYRGSFPGGNFLFGIVGGGVQLGPLLTAATWVIMMMDKLVEL
jgi:hypothetical protein